MEITDQWLKKHNACLEGLEWISGQSNRDEISILIKLRFDWANWYIAERLNKMRKVEYAVYAARLVLEVYEDKHPGDNRVRKAIEAAERYLKNPWKKTKDAAADASYVACAADTYATCAAAAIYAACAARATDTCAAYVAACAARAACATDARAAAIYAARATDARATDACATDAIKKKIINHGIKLIREMK